MSRNHILILSTILILGFIFRTFQVIDRFEFGHDGDLYSWIVKDIILDGHLRLVGQETSAPGIFIGPLFYYLIALFFPMFNMDPIGAIVPITIIGIVTIFSYYWVFSSLFNKNIGLIASFLYAVLLSSVQTDRNIFPSTLSNIWVIWYFYCVISIARGNFKSLPILGILIGLIWHIHIALIPSLIAIPAAFLQSKEIPSKKYLKLFIISLIITSLPLIIFELRHNFQQTFSFLNNFTTFREGPTGLYKFQLVLEMVTKNINTLFFAPQSIKIFQTPLFVLAILTSTILLIKKKLLSKKELIPLFAWILGAILFFSLSSSNISEYYFYNIEIIFIAILSFWLYVLFKSSILGRNILFGILLVILIKNFHFLITQDYYHKGYYEKKAVVQFIVDESRMRKFPCFSISYITTPGENVGFRYFFFLKKAHLIPPGTGAPVYNIVIPDELSKEEVKEKFGHIGIIPPENFEQGKYLNNVCNQKNSNLEDPMFGYVD